VRAVEISLLGSQERHTPRTLPGAARGDSWINNQSRRNGVSQMTVQSLWEHYSREELPFKDFSTQDGYLSYAKNWILPRWGRVLLLRVKTVEVERWLRDATVSNGTRAKIKCVMSALFSHAVRWEFASTNAISSGTPVGSGGKRGPSVGVRVSAKRQKAPIVCHRSRSSKVLRCLSSGINCWFSWMARWEHAEGSLQLCGGSCCRRKPRNRLHPNCTQIPKVPICKPLKQMAGTPGLEPATSAVTVNN
jgi:hypothetical protein